MLYSTKSLICYNLMHNTVYFFVNGVLYENTLCTLDVKCERGVFEFTLKLSDLRIHFFTYAVLN